MSTTNHQSIQQINTAALRGTREAHHPDAGQPKRKQSVKELRAAASQLASYIRKHAVPLNKMGGK
jgi:hypothetical protein